VNSVARARDRGYARPVRRLRFRIVYLVLLPAIAVAACVLGYYTYVTASQFDQLGEQSIAHSTLLLVEEKVDRIERGVIDADNAVLHVVNVDHPDSVDTAWMPLAERISPSVRAVLVLDDGGAVLSYAARASEEDKRDFLKVFLERILPELQLERLGPGRLKHLHGNYADQNYLVSYIAEVHRGRRYYLVAHHDTGYLVREEFPALFADEEGKQLYNVVDEDNHRIFGPSLAGAGDYVVGRRFPTTLYMWRLQVAPKQAPLLEAKGRSRRFNEAGLLGLSFGIILLGIVFLLYAADKERRLNALKSEFIANVSHELKTPLSAIRMFGELLLTKRVPNDKKKEEYLAIICRESERLSALIENVLDFAAVERGVRTYEMRAADVSAVVARTVETFRHRIEHEGTEVRVERIGDAMRVRIDEQEIFLAVLNLLDNAAKYGGGTPIGVTVEAKRHEVQIRVRDRGAGIPEDDLRRVFDRFFRSRGSPSRGSGIGLALVKHIAEAHGGRAWATNAPDGGAVVGFSIRRKRAAKGAIDATGPAPAPAASPAAPAIEAPEPSVAPASASTPHD